MSTLWFTKPSSVLDDAPQLLHVYCFPFLPTLYDIDAKLYLSACMNKLFNRPCYVFNKLECLSKPPTAYVQFGPLFARWVLLQFIHHSFNCLHYSAHLLFGITVLASSSFWMTTGHNCSLINISRSFCNRIEKMWIYVIGIASILNSIETSKLLHGRAAMQ